MKQMLVLFISIYFSTSPLFAQTRESPRARALAEQAKTYGDRNPFSRQVERVLADFQKTPKIEIFSDYFRSQFFPDVTPQAVLALWQTIYGAISLTPSKTETQVVEGRRISVLRKGAHAFILVDGVARLLLSMAGREATLSPILTFGQVQSGLTSAPNDREPIPQVRVRVDEGTSGTEDFYKVGAWAEFGVGFVAGFLGTAFRIHESVPNRNFGRVLRIGGPLLFVDGAARLLEIDEGRNPSLLPIASFAGRTIANQGFYGDLTIGDLTEELLRRWGFDD